MLDRMAHSAHADHGESSLNRTALQATLHCLTGCSIGEVLGMVIATAAELSNAASIGISIVLAFVFGYGLTLLPLVRAALPFGRAARLALASDTLSITTMEIVDNAFVALVPGALAAGLTDSLFWWSLAVSLAIAFCAAFPVNRWLIARGKGHAVVHEYHGHHA
jgi:formate/nitrite transporter FocA (FNT family)